MEECGATAQMVESLRSIAVFELAGLITRLTMVFVDLRHPVIDRRLWSTTVACAPIIITVRAHAIVGPTCDRALQRPHLRQFIHRRSQMILSLPYK